MYYVITSRIRFSESRLPSVNHLSLRMVEPHSVDDRIASAVLATVLGECSDTVFVFVKRASVSETYSQ